MKIAFYDTKPYDKIWFEPLAKEYDYKIKYFDYKLNSDTAVLSKGYDAVCVFVNDTVDKETIDILCENGVKIIALRCAGYNNVDLKAAKGRIKIVRVPAYSPAAVAEHAAALLLTVNRKTHRAYIRTKDSNFNINGLLGVDLKGKTAGIIGTGQIGRMFVDICRGFHMDVVAYDPYPAKDSDIEYVSLDRLFEKSDIISLHCPLTKETHHIINSDSIEKMRDNVIIINTSRGRLIDSAALIDGLKSKKIGGAGLDVYEEESEYFFEDFSNEIIKDDELARLLSFPNVVMTSHQGFFTREAMQAIAMVTIENLWSFDNGKSLENEVCYKQ
ncbi:MAG: 2-hydroxyacid dehydrogenase [Clostridia bacterium]|nr:2-hydroxyacid dehydrogenase [Clostridia bacterium]